MGKPRGGWSDPSQARPSSELDIRFGHGLLERESTGWPRYLAVTSPSAYKAAGPHLSREPAAVENARSLDWKHLQAVSDALPDDAELVVGVGGGTALDASKFVALAKGLPVILVPTVVSSGAVIHGPFGRFEGHGLVGTGEGFPWIDVEHVVVDYDIVLKAPYYLNTAGLGDVICSYCGIAEWRRNARLGIGPAYDEAAIAAGVQFNQDVVTQFPKTFAEDRALTADSVRFITTALKDRDDHEIKHPAAIQADHPFLLSTEEVNNKGWIHGELAALGAVVIAWHCEEGPETFIAELNACRVRWRPSETGLLRDELMRGLEYAPTFLSDKARGRDVHSILRDEPIVGQKFDALWDYLHDPK